MNEQTLANRVEEADRVASKSGERGVRRDIVRGWIPEIAALEAEVERLRGTPGDETPDENAPLGEQLMALCNAAREQPEQAVGISAHRLSWMAGQADHARHEIERLRELEALVAEAGRVEFRNDMPGQYPLAVWAPGREDRHPMTWGATLEMMNQRGGRVTAKMIEYALEKLREEVAEETKEETSCEK